MKLSESTKGILALWLLPGLGPKRIQKLLDSFPSVMEIFSADRRHLSLLLGIDLESAALIANALESKQLEEELRYLADSDVRLIDITHSSYPLHLKEIYNAPPVLYIKGDVDLNQGFHLAMVGSRKASYSGIRMCERLITDISSLKPETTIVSGLALGIDSSAHNAALESGLKTIAVLANGLSSIYPNRNRDLAKRIEKQGALISEFPMTTKAMAKHFPLRNRIISGLSKGVVVMEAGEKSGAAITAGYALEQNRELFALPGTADSRYHRGTNRLIQKGHAKLVLEANDILEEFADVNHQITTEDLLRDQKLDHHQSIDASEKLILDLLDRGALNKDTLVQKAGIPIQKLLASLTNLELKGFVVCKPGAVYEKVE